MAHKITHPKKRAFLAAFSEVGNITVAAEAADIHRRTHYDWMADDDEYAEAFHDAKEAAADRLEEEARRRAVQGVEEPVGWYQGSPGGTITRYSDTLLIFLLKGVRPEKYRETVKQSPEDAETMARRLKAALSAIEETDGE